MRLLKVFLYHRSNKVFCYLCHKYMIMPYMFRSDFSFRIKQIYLYVDDRYATLTTMRQGWYVSYVLLLMRIALFFYS